MSKPTKSGLNRFWGLCKEMILKRGSDPVPKKNVSQKKTTPPQKNVEQIYSKGAVVYSPGRQKKLEALCESLFAQKELVTTGKLQLIGLGKIKKNLGKKWEGLQQIVYTEVEESISKYMMKGDIFIRYKDDTYVIVFAEAGLEEAQIKATLIAEEIRRRLFGHEEEELRNIDVKEAVAVVRTDRLRQAGGLSETMDIVFEDIEEEKKREKAKRLQEKRPVAIPQALEVDPYGGKPGFFQERSQKEDKSLALNFSYVPLWNVQKNRLTTYLCLARDDNLESNPFDAHKMVFLGRSPKGKNKIDLLILKAVIKELAAVGQEMRNLSIICPLHYETLYNAENYEQYMLECQHIPEDKKHHLIFMLWDLPDKMHMSNIPKVSVPLKQHCSAIYAKVRPNTTINFSFLRECGFEAVGMCFREAKGNENELHDKLNNFNQKAKRLLIPKTFILDMDSLKRTTSAVSAGYDFLGGPVIHETVSKPDSTYHFKHERLFSDLLHDKKHAHRKVRNPYI